MTRSVDVTLNSILGRAREEACVSFENDRKRIEAEMAARGLVGGPVFVLCCEAAEGLLRRFGARAIPELLEVLRDASGTGTPRPDALAWLRENVTAHVNGLADGFGQAVDELRTTGGMRGGRERLEAASFGVKR